MPQVSAPSAGGPSAAAAEAPAGQPPPSGGAASAPAPARPDPRRVKPAVSNRTMLGAAPPAALVAQAAGAPASTPAAPAPGAPAPGPQSNRTMLGVGLGGDPAAGPAAPAAPVTPAAAAAPGAMDVTIDPIGGLTPPRRRGPGRLVAALVALGLAVVAGVAAFVALRGSPDVSVSVGQTDEGEVLVVEVPGAPDGTRVRFHGRERPLSAGRATFPLAANDLRLGDNELTVEVIEPDGEARQVSVVLSLVYRVRADLSALDEDPPSLRVVVDAPPSATVTLDERPVPLDETGHGHLAFPLDPASEGQVYERTIHYRVVVDGEPSDGEVQVRIPFATLQVDRPGARAVTDKSAIELVGAAHPDAQVTLDGRPLELTDGRFVATLALPELGETQHRVVARQPGRAPRTKVLTIRRVADLAAEAAAYPVDPTLTYARIAQNPESYRGQHVALEGRVYNVDVHEGRSVLQVLVRDCPEGRRCALWVAFDGAADAQLNDWVRVVGEVAGEQQFRTPSGEVRTVPRVDAAFVVPASSANLRRRGRR